jgi:3-deoxy-D-manno-octulosonic-acid transferase
MRFLYIFLSYLLAPLMVLAMLWRGVRDRSYLRGMGQRFGFGKPVANGPSIWVHAVSVGEVQAASVLIRELLTMYPAIPLVLTTVTPTGAEHARRLFGASVDVRFVPYDLVGPVRRFFSAINPRVAVILETELWPNLYHECGRRKVPLVLASARISPKSVGRYRVLAGLFRETLSHGIVIAAQSAQDAERFRSIGANTSRTHVTGNIKFDLSVSESIRADARLLRQRYVRSRPAWVAGSTHAGEEQILFAAQRRLRTTVTDALLIMVPRHPNRFAEVAAWLQREQVRYVTRSSGAPVAADTEVLLIDTLGELQAFYGAADVAFVGGSLVPIGGHNLLEPAALGVPVLTGPNNYNAEDIAAQMIGSDAARVVHDAGELGSELERLLTDEQQRHALGQRGLAFIETNRGALARLLALLAPVITSAGLPPASH